MTRPLAVLALIVSSSLSAYAQPSVHMVWSTAAVGPRATTVLSVDPVAERLLRPPLLLATSPDSPPYVTPDGLLLVWQSRSPETSTRHLTVHRLVTGTTSTLPTPFDACCATAGNPARPEIYGFDAGGLIALSYAGVGRLNSPACSNHNGISVSANGLRVAFACGGPEAFRGAVLESTTGAIVATFNSPGADYFGSIALSRDGQELYTSTTVSPDSTRLRRYQVSTGAVLAEVVVSPVRISPEMQLKVDPRTGQLFGNSPNRLHRFDASTLMEVAAVDLSNLPESWHPVTAFDFDPRAPRLYAASRWAFPSDAVINKTAFMSIDTDTLEIVLNRSVPFVELFDQFFSPTPSIAVAARPAAPTRLAAVVQGRSVQLTWIPGNPFGSTLRFVIEAGSAPGLANLAMFDVGLESTPTINDVPPGTYYVRVRPENATGSGQPSNEIVVTVP
jgi:hypothetical protein